MGEYMKLISMQIHNFKTFHGLSNPIEFGSSGDKNIIVIFGGAGSGKTNITKALRWLLYGNLPVPRNKAQQIINASAINEANAGEELSYWVALSFNYQGKVYEAKRTQKFSMNDNAKWR